MYGGEVSLTAQMAVISPLIKQAYPLRYHWSALWSVLGRRVLLSE